MSPPTAGQNQYHAQQQHDARDDQGRRREIVIDVLRRLRAVPVGQPTFSAEAKPSSDRDPERERHGSHASEPGEKHEDLEWCRRRQHGGDDHSQQPVPPEQTEASLDLRLAEPPPEKRFAAFPGNRVEDEASGRGAKGGSAL